MKLRSGVFAVLEAEPDVRHGSASGRSSSDSGTSSSGTAMLAGPKGHAGVGGGGGQPGGPGQPGQQAGLGQLGRGWPQAQSGSSSGLARYSGVDELEGIRARLEKLVAPQPQEQPEQPGTA
jgi:hypothetical protein